MSIAFLEGAEYAAATEEATSIDYAERYDDERLAQGFDDLVFQMRDDLITAINELRSQLAEATRLLEVAHDRIAELEGTIDFLDSAKTVQKARIIQLEAQLSVALAARHDRGSEGEQAATGRDYAEGCKP